MQQKIEVKPEMFETNSSVSGCRLREALTPWVEDGFYLVWFSH